MLYCVDLFLCFTVFSVLNIAYWRGAWGLLDLYLFPGEMDYEDYEVQAIKGSAISYAIGASSRIIRVALEPTCRKLHNALRYGWAQYLAKIIFNFFDGCFMIAQWRGLYNILDFYVGYDLLPNIISLSIATVILVGSRSFSSTLGLPMSLIRDSREDFYVCWPRYRTKVRQFIDRELNTMSEKVYNKTMKRDCKVKITSQQKPKAHNVMIGLLIHYPPESCNGACRLAVIVGDFIYYRCASKPYGLLPLTFLSVVRDMYQNL